MNAAVTLPLGEFDRMRTDLASARENLRRAQADLQRERARFDHLLGADRMKVSVDCDPLGLRRVVSVDLPALRCSAVIDEAVWASRRAGSRAVVEVMHSAIARVVERRAEDALNAMVAESYALVP